MGSQSDHARSDKRQSFNLVHEASVSFLRRLVRSSGVGPNDLEDALQEILMAVYKRLNTFDVSRLLNATPAAREEIERDELDELDEDEPVESEEVSLEEALLRISALRSRRAWGPLHGWIFGIAWRQLSRYRDRAYRRREVPAGLHGNVVFAAVDMRPGVEHHIAEAERAQVVDRLLASLVPQRRVVLVMHDMLGIPVVDIARELGINENTAQNRIRLAREDFRAAVKRLSEEQRRALRIGETPFAGEATTPRRPAPKR
ncbi:RNA polymerase sigma factor [Sorangium sp. So ce131]|uniref:RNA polymerase sigma factor n=1 Tax=Sorangium sp. So ce131 TaxID=3133282 RepID=UPI003F63F97F